jgi:hypothetical protein
MLFGSEPDIACHAQVNDDVPLLPLLFGRQAKPSVFEWPAALLFQIELVRRKGVSRTANGTKT